MFSREDPKQVLPVGGDFPLMVDPHGPGGQAEPFHGPEEGSAEVAVTRTKDLRLFLASECAVGLV
jgi:hypothetical protein